MRIGIDARLYGEEKNRGLGRYVTELIRHLEHSGGNDEFFIFLTKDNFDEYRPASPRFHKRLWNVRWYTAREQLPPCPMYRENIDLAHFPHWNVPLLFRKPFIVTIHDLILLESNRKRQASTLGAARYAVKYLGFRIALRHALFASRSIITISGTVRSSIEHRFPRLPKEKIRMIYQGIASSREAGEAPLPNSARKPYLLYVGGAYPHKNLPFLLRAFSRLREIPGCPPYQLILAGKPDFFYRRVETQARADRKLAPLLENRSIFFAGQVGDKLLGTLYRNAELLVTASLAEGMGFSPLEALCVGTPAAVSDLPIFREILEDTAIYFSPRDVENCAFTLFSALTNATARDTIKERALELQKKYAWQACADRTLEVYHKNAPVRTV